jgi:hypothetical protein
MVANKTGQVLYAAVARHVRRRCSQPAGGARRPAGRGKPQPAAANGILQVVTIRSLERRSADPRGRSAPASCSTTRSPWLKNITGSDIAFGMDGRILASTLPHGLSGAREERLPPVGISRLTLGGSGAARGAAPFAAAGERDGSASGPVAILRSLEPLVARSHPPGLALTAVLAKNDVRHSPQLCLKSL